MIQNTFEVYNELSLKRIFDVIAGLAVENIENLIGKSSNNSLITNSQASRLPDSPELVIEKKMTLGSMGGNTHMQLFDNNLKPDINKLKKAVINAKQSSFKIIPAE